jgi:hypothetical protein
MRKANPVKGELENGFSLESGVEIQNVSSRFSTRDDFP